MIVPQPLLRSARYSRWREQFYSVVQSLPSHPARVRRLVVGGRGRIGYGRVSEPIQAFAFSKARLLTSPSSITSETFNYPGTTPSISASGLSDAIVWSVQAAGGTGVLRAYDASNLAIELYNSDQSRPRAETILRTTSSSRRRSRTARSIQERRLAWRNSDYCPWHLVEFPRSAY